VKQPERKRKENRSMRTIVILGQRALSLVFSFTVVLLLMLIVLAACGNGAVYSSVVNSL
jgi:hypothetical protein